MFSHVKSVASKLVSLLKPSDNSKSAPVNTAALASVLSDTKGLVTILPEPETAETFSWSGPDKIIDMSKVLNAPDDGIDRMAILSWLEALESDKIKQTRGMLVNGNGQGFCCLGVMCKLEDFKVARAWAGGQYTNSEGDVIDIINAFFIDDVEHTGKPPNYILKKYGFNHDFATKTSLNVGKYIGMNDNGSTFKEIAAELRKEYKEKGIL